MSLRAAKKPIEIPKNVEVEYKSGVLTVKGQKDKLSLVVNRNVGVEVSGDVINILPLKNESKFIKAITGTTCAHINNMIKGVTKGFEKRLILVGVGYRAQQKGTGVSLSLGYSHPIEF